MEGREISLRIHTLDIGDRYPVRIMGVLNLSPESFYDASVVQAPGVAHRALQMIRGGAEILDLGGRSTAPKSPSISVGEELERVKAGLEALLSGGALGDTLLSVDTQYAVVADLAYGLMRAAGKAEQFLLNDVSCLRTDPGLAAWAARVGCPVILMASHERPGDSLGVEQTLEDLEHGIRAMEAHSANARSRLIVDPAIGLWSAGKTARWDCEILRELPRFRSFGLPILVGISRKSFIGEILSRPDPRERLAGTLAATAVAVRSGAHIVRTHDVTPDTVDTVRIAEAIRTPAHLEARAG